MHTAGVSINSEVLYTASSKPAGSQLNEPPPQEVRSSPFQAENILFLFCYRQGKKKTPRKQLPTVV